VATDPAFAATINNGCQLLGATAETDLQAPAQTSTVLTAGATGTKIEEIVVEASKSGSLVATTVAGLVYLFLYDGSTYHLFDTITVAAITASATAAPFRATKTYTNLVLKTGWSLRASQSIAGNVSILKVHAFGADL
jgi:hypothetical protein